MNELPDKSDLSSSFTEQRAYYGEQFDELQSHMETRFAEWRAHNDAQFAKIAAAFTKIYWMLAIIVAATVLPLLERLASL